MTAISRLLINWRVSAARVHKRETLSHAIAATASRSMRAPRANNEDSDAAVGLKRSLVVNDNDNDQHQPEMPKSIQELKPIPPNPPRWEPSTDPSSITIPGLDTTASVNDQIDQIDQLITLKLQDIDANFSKMQQVLSNRILPAVKRFAIGTEPVREAAKFWTSFFEHAAQVHIPTSDHPSSMQEPSATSSSSHDVTSTSESSSATPDPNSNTFDLNRTPSESSFLPAHAAVSSTPAAATARAQAANSTFFTSQPSVADPSWSALVESPLVRLDRELREFTRADPQPASTSTYTDTDSLPTPTRTPHVSARVEPRDRSRIAGPTLSNATTTMRYEDYEEEEEEPTLPVGMSPPVVVPFARLPTLGRSPAKSAAAHIRQTLVRDALRDAGGASSSSASASGSSVLSPPSLSRYTRGASASLASLGADPELDSLIRRVSLLPRDPQSRSQRYVSSASTSTASVPANPFSAASYPSTTPVLAPTHEAMSPMTPPPLSDAAAVGGVAATPESDDGSASTFSSSGEEDSVHNTAHPSAAFLLASRQRGRNDDDDNDDDEDDSLDEDPDAATASFEPVHPFARAVAAEAEDDSFDSLDGDAPEETVFGARPVKRGAALPLRT
ncbi:DASH complex subunit Ask1-domain-containing protein [Lactarius psammicola]|nr:DASH complex subunit Ask1-domain-containing protein [Lactarius psammicola]